MESSFNFENCCEYASNFPVNRMIFTKRPSKRSRIDAGCSDLDSPRRLARIPKRSNEPLRYVKSSLTSKNERPERYETVRAFGLSVYVASLSRVSRYLSDEGYPTLITPLSIAIAARFSIQLTAKHLTPDYSLLPLFNHSSIT